MRAQIVSSFVALLGVVAVSCGGAGGSESGPETRPIDAATTAPAPDTTVQPNDDSTPPTTEPPAADTTVRPNDDSTPPTTEPPSLDPLVLAPMQLDELSLPAELAGELMGAETVEVDEGSLFMMLVGELPPGAEVEAHDYFSLDSGARTLGVGAVDYASVIMLLVAEEPDVVPLFDQITNAEPEYTRWVPTTIRGAEVAEQAVAIPYEGEPDDEPAFEAVLSRRDKLIVAVAVSGSDTAAMAETAVGITELVFERASGISSNG